MNKLIGIILTIIFMTLQACSTQNKTNVQFSQLPQIPDEVGFAGSFSGISNGNLLVAGGSNFPNTRPWSGGVKHWSDKVFVLESESGSWKEIGKLPRPIGYGVSITWKDGLIILGGADQELHYPDAYLLKYTDGQLLIDTLPALPEANANACAALIGDVIYVAGGLSSPQSKETKKVFWSLDLSKTNKQRTWQVLQTWPGESRMLSVAGVLNNEFYLMSGVHLKVPANDSLAHRQYLKDAYRYSSDRKWMKICDLPYSVTAAPGPAYTDGQKTLLIFGGDDGSRAEQNAILKDKHPGFRTEILAYNFLLNVWNVKGNIITDKQPDPENDPNASTWAPVTTPLVIWNDRIIIPGGEVRPGVRTNRVLVVKP